LLTRNGAGAATTRHGFDVSQLVQRFGCGEHPAAAGFNQPIQSRPPVVQAAPPPD
jgi:hypothetical protein